MSQMIQLRLMVAVFASALWLPLYWWDKKKGRHFEARLHTMTPLLFLTLFPITFFLSGTTKYLQGFLSFLVSYSVYAALLLALTPLLRKRYCAELCADLWLVPNISYLVFVYESSFLKPLTVLRVDRAWFWALFGVWAAGFLGVLVWKIVSHLRFRRRLLKNAAQDDYLSYMYAEERRSVLAGSDRKPDSLPNRKAIVYSPAAAAPLSIGLFKPRIVLPRRLYEGKDLRLILRHETTHLLRADNDTKFFLTVMSACYWFLPFSWLGISKAAEDLELCCDEIATEHLKPEERKRYAELLLSNAGSAPGFTTCLSATASGLRYRLQRVMHPGKAKSGIFLLTAVLLLFLSSVQAICFAPSVGSLDGVIFDKIDNVERVVMHYEDADDLSQWKACSCDGKALRAVLSRVEAYRAESYYIDSAEFYGEELFFFTILGEEGAAKVSYYENAARVTHYQLNPGGSKGVIFKDDEQSRLWKRAQREEIYLYGEAPDWEALYALAGPPIEN